MGATFQIFLIGVPTVVAVYTTSSFARFMSLSLIVFVTNIALLGFIFIPKMFNEYAIFQESKSNSNSYQGSRYNSKSAKKDALSPAISSAVASGNIL